MNAAARVSLDQLLREGRIERVPVDASVVAALQKQATAHLRTSRCGLEVDDAEGAFQIAYDASRKLCLALLLSAGFRPREGDKGQHATTFEGAMALAASFGQRELVNDASNLRFVRNHTEYRAEMVAEEDAQEALAIGEELVGAVADPIAKLLAAAG